MVRATRRYEASADERSERMHMMDRPDELDPSQPLGPYTPSTGHIGNEDRAEARMTDPAVTRTAHPTAESAEPSQTDRPADVGSVCPTGTFTYQLATGELQWSDETYTIHGYHRGEIVPTYELGRSHVLPHQREQGQAFWEDVVALGGPLSTYLTLEDAAGRFRQVLVTGNTISEHGDVTAISGLLVDLTASIRDDSHRLAHEAVAASARARSIIEQAKGIIMGQTGISAEDAFRLLSRRSQNTNRKVNEVARTIVNSTSHINEADTHALFAARAILDTF